MSALSAETKPHLITQRLPNLFGRLTSILSDHEQLKGTLRGLADLCDALDSGVGHVPVRLDPARILGNLHAYLSRHFAAEESPSHFGLIARENPELLPQVVELKTDHVAFLDEIAQLRGLADDTARWGELSTSTRRLIARLAEHEQGESELVQRFLAPADLLA